MIKRIKQGRWTDAEHQRYEEGRKLGLNWDEIFNLVSSRSAKQCRSHHQKMKMMEITKRHQKALIPT